MEIVKKKVRQREKEKYSWRIESGQMADSFNPDGLILLMMVRKESLWGLSKVSESRKSLKDPWSVSINDPQNPVRLERIPENPQMIPKMILQKDR